MTSEVLRTEATLKLEDICEDCGLTQIEVSSYIEEGIIDVEGDETAKWRFSETHIVQIKKAARLEKDLGLNPAGTALALELMSQINDLEREIKRLKS